jgi:hemolysin III
MIISWSNKEEIANSLTHGIGLLASIVGLLFLLIYREDSGQPMDTFIFGIYGLSMVSCYLSSTLYHLVSDKIMKQRLKVFDHISIYLLIAGTYTPFCYFIIEGSMGSTILLVIWALALAGSVFKLFYVHRFQRLSTIIYVGMGWMAIFAVKPLIINLDSVGLIYLVLGGLSYTTGVYFYVKDYKPFHHAIWHLFVLGGSAFHFMSVWSFAR